MKQFFLPFIILLSLSFSTFSQENLRRSHFNLNKDGVAISGYDAVAYFTKNKAIKGDKKLSVNADGIIYYFSSQVNKDLFLKNWRNYEPQYGGWCAYAMGATGEKVEIDPETFKIVNGKLYLFYHSWVNNTLTKWNKDETNLKNKADAHWTRIYK